MDFPFGWAEIFHVFEMIILAILLGVSNSWTGALGGLLHAIITLPVNMSGVIGRVGRFILQNPLHLSALTKPLAWLVSSSGMLLGLGIHYLIWGNNYTTGELWIILIFATLSFLAMVEDLFTFDNNYSYIDNLIDEIAGFSYTEDVIRQLAQYGGKDEFRSLARTLFVDQTLPQLFKLLTTIGILYFVLGQLNYLPTTTDSPPNLFESVLIAFSVIDITGEIPIPFTGNFWNVLRVITAFLAFFWLVMFVTMGMASVDDAGDRALARMRERFRPRTPQEIVDSAMASMDMTASTEGDIADSNVDDDDDDELDDDDDKPKLRGNHN